VRRTNCVFVTLIDPHKGFLCNNQAYMGSPVPTLTAGLISWGIETAPALVLLIRLYFLRLQGVYRVFVVYLIAEILGPLLYLLSGTIFRLDYRVLYLSSRPIYWFLYIAMVYALARVIMRSVPGVYDLSRKVLQVSFIAAVVVGGAVFVLGRAPSSHSDPLHVLTLLGRNLERSVTLTALLLLLGVLGFMLWFPVQVPRNLAVFSGAYLVFFTATVIALFLGDFFRVGNSARILSRAIEVISALCYCWWLFTLSKAGEQEPVRLGHGWKPAEQEKLMTKLNAINEALLAGSRTPHDRVV
jgi:hypothetical protein